MSSITPVAESTVTARAWSVPAELPYWILRVGAALCFIGHGAFGFITKTAWVPYFAVVGIPEPLAWRLMPLVGAVDVTVGMMVLFAPRRFALGYMGGWALWTALLRPLSGEPFFETLERAGNYGVPLALLLMSGWPRDVRSWFTVLVPAAVSIERVAIVRRVLQITSVLLLAGHGALGAITAKAVLARRRPRIAESHCRKRRRSSTRFAFVGSSCARRSMCERARASCPSLSRQSAAPISAVNRPRPSGYTSSHAS